MKKKNIYELKRAGICCEEEMKKVYRFSPLPLEAITFINNLHQKKINK